ncbi:PQQ-binding-like beta-propeller repeat protein [Streptomyces sp. NPDC059389]|uniref:outer membrane protein assembly factor BamB family protein n=1 Tax=Streptomyces sp. NPDC059389 TaxID=3346818 RepID=UPI00367788DD
MDPANGSLLWSARTTTPGTLQTGAPLHGGGLVLTVTEGGRLLRALDPATGTERWNRKMPQGAQDQAGGRRGRQEERRGERPGAPCVRGDQQGRADVRDGRRGRVARGEVAGGPRLQGAGAGGPLLQRHDRGRDQRHRQTRRQGRCPGARTPDGVRHRQDQDRYGDRHVPQVGEALGDGVGERAHQGCAEVLVRREQRTRDQDLPGRQGEAQQGEKEEDGRPSRNRGGGSGTAGRIGLPGAPGGLGRTAVRSVRSVRERRPSAALGKPGTGVATGFPGAGCLTHLQKPYGSGKGTDSRNALLPSAPHIFFTAPARYRG